MVNEQNNIPNENTLSEGKVTETREPSLRDRSFNRARVIGNAVSGYFRNAKRLALYLVIVVAVLAFAGGSLLFTGKKDETNTHIQNVTGPSFSVLKPTTPYQEHAVKEYDQDRKETQTKEGESYIPMAMGVPQEDDTNLALPQTNVPTPQEIVDKVKKINDPIADDIKDPAEPMVTKPDNVKPVVTDRSGTTITINKADVDRITKLFAAWHAQTTRQPQYEVIEYGVSESDQKRQGSSGSSSDTNTVSKEISSTDSNSRDQGELLVSPGDVVYASLTFTYNSDLPSVPVSAVIHGGKLNGAVLIGQPQPVRSNVVIKYNSLTLKGHTYQVQGYAVGNNCNCLALGAEYDPRIISRVILPAAAKFLTGFALPSLAGGTNVTVNGSTVISEQDDANKRDRVLSGVSSMADGAFDAYLDILPKNGLTRVYSGVPHAVFFTGELREQP